MTALSPCLPTKSTAASGQALCVAPNRVVGTRRRPQYPTASKAHRRNRPAHTTTRPSARARPLVETPKSRKAATARGPGLRAARSRECPHPSGAIGRRQPQPKGHSKPLGGAPGSRERRMAMRPPAKRDEVVHQSRDEQPPALTSAHQHSATSASLCATAGQPRANRRTGRPAKVSHGLRKQALPYRPKFPPGFGHPVLYIAIVAPDYRGSPESWVCRTSREGWGGWTTAPNSPPAPSCVWPRRRGVTSCTCPRLRPAIFTRAACLCRQGV